MELDFPHSTVTVHGEQPQVSTRLSPEVSTVLATVRRQLGKACAYYEEKDSKLCAMYLAFAQEDVERLAALLSGGKCYR